MGVVVGGVAPLAEDAVLGGGGGEGHLSALGNGLRGGGTGLAAVDADAAFWASLEVTVMVAVSEGTASKRAR